MKSISRDNRVHGKARPWQSNGQSSGSNQCSRIFPFSIGCSSSKHIYVPRVKLPVDAPVCLFVSFIYSNKTHRVLKRSIQRSPLFFTTMRETIHVLIVSHDNGTRFELGYTFRVWPALRDKQNVCKKTREIAGWYGRSGKTAVLSVVPSLVCSTPVSCDIRKPTVVSLRRHLEAV